MNYCLQRYMDISRMNINSIVSCGNFNNRVTNLMNKQKALAMVTLYIFTLKSELLNHCN